MKIPRNFITSWSKIIAFCFAIYPLDLLQAAAWKTIPDCELDDSAYGDGDSFHVRAGTRNYIIRLYFVDCAETNENFPQRNADQAAYWKVDSKRVLQLGEDAARFTKKKLANRFTVITKLEDARGESNQKRYFGFVLPEAGKENLAELLVANGLARIYGATARPPDGLDIEAFRQTLQRLENRAKGQKLGGWGGGQAVKPNDNIFKRTRPLEMTAPSPSPPRTPSPFNTAPTGMAPREALLNINTASADELGTLPGVGQILAARIIAERPFAKVEDLKKVQGLSAKNIGLIVPLACVTGD